MATATKKAVVYPVHELSLNAIKVDYSLQSRVETSVEYMREYSEAMLRGDIFPPVKVIKDQNGKYWLYDGFHRFGATKKIGAKSIRAEVREGTKEDAYVLSAGSNREFSIKRSANDIKKACYMLFVLPEWWSKTDSVIASHIGISSTSVNRIRHAYCSETGTPVPVIQSAANGATRVRNILKEQARHGDILDIPIRKEVRGKQVSFYADILGNKIRLGGDEKQAAARLASMAFDSCGGGPVRYQPNLMMAWLRDRNIHLTKRSVGVGDYDCDAYVGHDCVVVVYDHAKYDILRKMGAVLVIKSQQPKNFRSVILCQKSRCDQAFIDAGSSVGIEFMEPEEFVGSLA